MPRKTLSIPNSRIERLSILDESGKVDKDLEPDLPPADLRKVYRYMLLSRQFDERMLKLQRQGRIGTFPPSKGQEAVAIGSVYALAEGDWLVPAYREPGAMFWRGWTLESWLIFWGGSIEGSRLPDGVKSLPINIPVGSQGLHGAGIAYAMKYRGDKNVAMIYFGDGATSQGDMMEAMNFAGVWQAPAVFVCSNNQWAISTPRSVQTAAATIAQKAIAFGMPGVQVDGNDVLAMIVVAREAVERARKGGGPTLIEAETYRLSLHTTADDPTKYRKQEEVDLWEKRDPLTRFETYLRRKKVLTDKVQQEIEADIDHEIRRAIAVMEERLAQCDVMDVFENVYAEPGEELLAQRRELEAYLAAGRNGSKHQ